jgi:hypothetical protein
MSADSGPGRREVAQRLFAAEFDDADFSYSESDEERAPNYVVTPTGARANRVFAVGVLTAVERVNEDVLRARVADPTGAFVTYAGQYQPDAMAVLDRTDPPEFVALTGKARTFQPEDSDRVFTSVRPESVNVVDAATRDRWVVSAAEATLSRVALVAESLATDVRGEDLRATLEARGAPESLAAGIPLAIDHYGTTPAYLDAVRELALEALGVVEGSVEEVTPLTISPGEGGGGDVGPLPDPSALSTLAAGAVGGDAVDAAAATDEGAETDETGTTGATDAATTTASEDGTREAGTGAEESTATTAPAGTGAGNEPTAEDAPEAESSGPDPTTGGSAGDADEPAADEPTADEPAADEPAADEPTADEPTADEPTADEPTADEPTADEPTADEPAADEPTADDATGGLGDFDGGDEAADAGGDDALGDFDEGDDDGAGERYELDDEERAELESEYGTEFETGTEVDDAGEAGIDVPDADELAEAAEAEASTAETPDAPTGTPSDDAGATEATDATGADGAAADAGDSGDAADAADAGEAGEVDLSEAVVEAMDDLDDGDGAAREEVVARVAEDVGADADAVEEAIQDALMGGKCYEPTDGRLKAI